MSNIRHSTNGWSNVEYLTFEAHFFGCWIFDIRRTADRMSKIRHPKKGALDVEYSTFNGRLIECRIFDIRLCGRSNRKNPIQQIRQIESNLRHSIRQNPHVYSWSLVNMLSHENHPNKYTSVIKILLFQLYCVPHISNELVKFIHFHITFI